MLKRDISYDDFDGKHCVETFYFNVSEAELVEMEVEYEGGFSVLIQKIIKEDDRKQLIKIFKEIVLKAYGKKSDDGKRFIKTDQLRVEFSQTNAYNKLFMELATDDKAATIFLKGILPRDMVEKMPELVPSESKSPEST